MAKDKERSINPAQAQRKAEKAKALKKSRNEQQVKRNEKLARRNPDRIQRQIDDLKALEASGEIKPREKAILADLERDLRAVRKAKENVGNHGTPTGSGSRQSQTRYTIDEAESSSVLGKRRHDGQRKTYHDKYSTGSDTDDSVRNIPMPRDTPPPAPRSHRQQHRTNEQQQLHDISSTHSLPSKPVPVYESKTTYSSAPQLRDLKKEAISRFVPDIVRRKNDAVRGQGSLLEPEELDRLEKEGYYNAGLEKSAADKESPSRHKNEDHRDGDERTPAQAEAEAEAEAQRLQAEEARFQQELAEPMDVDGDDDNADNFVHSQQQPQEHDGKHQSGEAAKISDGQNAILEHDGDNDEDDDEDDYLPAFMSGRGVSINTSASQLQSQHTSSYQGSGSRIAAGLFAKLPKPRNETPPPSRHVQMEEVEDEDQ